MDWIGVQAANFAPEPVFTLLTDEDVELQGAAKFITGTN
jgi:hypothetical protein